MNKTCELNENGKKKHFRNNNKEFNESNGSKETCMQGALSIDDDTLIINLHEIKGNDEFLRYLDQNNLKKLKKNIIDDEYFLNDDDISNCFCNFNECSIKCFLRFLADCFSFISAVCLWGILDDIFIILSKDNNQFKLYYYLIFTIIFSSITFSFNFYSAKYSRKNSFISDDIESKA